MLDAIIERFLETTDRISEAAYILTFLFSKALSLRFSWETSGIFERDTHINLTFLLEREVKHDTEDARLSFVQLAVKRKRRMVDDSGLNFTELQFIFPTSNLCGAAMISTMQNSSNTAFTKIMLWFLVLCFLLERILQMF